jgi:hypothetical protein
MQQDNQTEYERDHEIMREYYRPIGGISIGSGEDARRTRVLWAKAVLAAVAFGVLFHLGLWIFGYYDIAQ